MGDMGGGSIVRLADQVVQGGVVASTSQKEFGMVNGDLGTKKALILTTTHNARQLKAGRERNAVSEKQIQEWLSFRFFDRFRQVVIPRSTQKLKPLSVPRFPSWDQRRTMTDEQRERLVELAT